MSGDREESFFEFKSNNNTWKNFLRSADGNRGKCKKCGRILSMGKWKSTSVLLNHWRMKHSSELDINSNSKKPRTGSEEDTTLKCMIAKLAAADNISFYTIARSHTLRDLFNGNNYVLPQSATTIREVVLSYAAVVKERLRDELKVLKEQGKSFSLTMDEWTSYRNRRFANVNIHWDDQFRSLGMLRCLGSMPAEKCEELLWNVLREYDLNAQDIIAITTDGAKVMLKMGRQLPFAHQVCVAHGLHLAVMEVIYSDFSWSPVGGIDDDGNEEEVLDDESSDFVMESVETMDNLELTTNFGIKDVIGKVR